MRNKFKNLSRRQKYQLLALIAGLLIAIGGVTVIILQRDQSNGNDTVANSEPTLNNSLCNEDEIGATLKSNFNNFTTDQGPSVSDTINSIKAVDGYENSMNCLFVLARYSTYSGALDDVNTYYAKLFSLRDANPDKWINSDYSKESVESVKEYYEAFKTSYEAQKDNLKSNRRSYGMEYTE